MKPVVASRNVICFLRPIHVSRRNGKLAVRQLLKKVSANQSPDFIVGSGIQGSPIGFFNPVIPTFFYKPIPANVPFYIYRRDLFYLKSAKIFRRGPIISEDVRRLSEDFQSCYGEFCLTRTQEHKGTLTSLLKKENSEKVDHPHRLFFSLFGSGLFK